jgi:hypothetical protein
MELTSNTTTLAIFAIVAAMGLVGVVAVEVVSISQDSEARGCRTSIAFNASKGRCFGHGP